MNEEVEKINNKIAELYTSIREEVNILNERLRELQDSCPHLTYESVYKSNTGNYDPSCDCYWVTVECLDCGKRMYFDSDKDPENYRKYGK